MTILIPSWVFWLALPLVIASILKSWTSVKLLRLELRIAAQQRESDMQWDRFRKAMVGSVEREESLQKGDGV